MTGKYRCICRECLKIFGTFDTPNVEIPTKCDACGGTKIATEKFEPNEAKQLSIEIAVFNKDTGVSKNCGFVISKEKIEKNRKNLNKMRVIFVEEMARSLHTIISSDALLVDLLGDVGKPEV